MSFVVLGIATGVGTLGAGFIGAQAAKDAAKKQAEAADKATELQRQMFEQQRADQEPWRQSGMRALAGLGSGDFQRDFTMDDFQKDPGFDFRLREGQKALERSKAASGSLMSGGTLKALTRYGQDFASNEFQNAYNRFNADRDRRFNRLASIAGLGQTATGQLGQAGMNFANQAGNNLMGAANASAAAGMAGANAWGGALQNIGKLGLDVAMTNKWMDMWRGGGMSPMVIPTVPATNLTMPTFGGR